MIALGYKVLKCSEYKCSAEKMHPLIIKFGPPKYGWMDVTFGNRKICVSDVPCDSLYELIKAMNNFLCGSEREVVEWSLEPDYERWIFDRTEGQPMMHIIDSEDVRWVSVTNAVGIIQMIAGSLDKRYEKSFRNNATINKNWSWDFPIENLRSLQKKLAEKRRG